MSNSFTNASEKLSRHQTAYARVPIPNQTNAWPKAGSYNVNAKGRTNMPKMEAICFGP